MRRVVGAATAAAFVLLTWAGPAVGASVQAPLSPDLTVTSINATAFPTVTVDLLNTGPTAVTNYSVSENGILQTTSTQTLSAALRPVGIVLVIDTSSSMEVDGKLAQAKAAADSFVDHKQANELVAVVAAGPVPRVAANLTADAGQLKNVIDGLAAQGDLALFDSIKTGASLFVGRPELLPTMIIVSDRGDGLSTSSGSSALGAEESAKASVFTVGIPGGAGFTSSELRQLATGGGQYVEVAAPTSLTAAIGKIQQALQSSAEVTYTSKAPKAKSLDLAITAGALQARAHTVPGAVSAGSNSDASGVTLTQAPGPLRGKAGVLIIAVLALAAAGLLAYAVLSLTAGGASSLETALQPYEEGASANSFDDAPDDGSFVSNALVSRVVERTAVFAKEKGILEKVETRLEQADLNLRASEAFFFYLVVMVVLIAAGLIVGGPLMAFFAFVVAGLGPPAALSFLAKRRLKKFNTALPDTLQLLASSLRAGFSFLQGVEAVSKEARPPMGNELNRVMVEARLGRPVEDALADCADRMQSPDFDWAVMAVRIQREVGGNLAELLETVGATMVERERLRRDVKSLTAEGRVSAIVLAIMPPGLGTMFYITNPTYMKVLFDKTGGQIALGLATTAALIGFVWMKKIVDIEV
jgi:tight adherence protein B